MTSKEFGFYIAKLIGKQDLTREETAACFREILGNKQCEMQQGAFLAALAAKGELACEIAAAWQSIYELDTVKVELSLEEPLVENCGTGMDSLKTFNVSTAASIIAAAAGATIARHGSRSITSRCGTIDMLELLGINVECTPEVVARSIERAGIGVFNGNSPLVHPVALGKILSQISFGTTLNIAASLANPASPKHAVRGVYCPGLLLPTAMAMKEIGYLRAIVVYGTRGEGVEGGIDEASTLGESYICELKEDGSVIEYVISPESFGIDRHGESDIVMGNCVDEEVGSMEMLLKGDGSRQRSEIACLNAGLVLYISGMEPDIYTGYERALKTLSKGEPMEKLREWASVQK
ncbi:MAG: anthranilate phosphoribosyltransferase [Eubacteriaceae bacterium]|nr:anthranilate phosphoribosyltransferase [Eubacteriaceae bacterium]